MLKVIAVVRVLLGLYLMGNGLNFFFHFFAFPPIENPVANTLMAGFVQSGMFEVVKVAEVLGGLALVVNFFVPVALVLVYPIVVIIGYIDVLVLGWELNGIPNGGSFFVIYSAMLLLYFPYYRSMFVRRAAPDPGFAALRAPRLTHGRD